jgi:site-specific recombinase XerD
MNETIKRFKRYLRRRYGDRSTPKHYLSDMRIFVQRIGNKSPTEVSVQDIDHFVDRQASQGLSPATINRRLATLRTFFEFLAAEEPDRPWPNPVIWRRHGIKQGEPLPRDLPDPSVERLFAAIQDERDRAIFGLMVGAGLRVGEVAAILLQDLEAPLSPGQMARLRVRGKGRKERIVWLTVPLYATVQAWLQKRPNSSNDHLFLNQHGRPLSVAGIEYRLKRHANSAGIQVTCHQLRHTFARRLAEQEMPIESLSKLLGHAQVQTTQIYTAGADPKLRDAFAKAIAQLEETPQVPVVAGNASALQSVPRRQREQADPVELHACLAVFDPLPAWLQASLQAYLIWRWRNWQPHMAKQHGRRLAHQLRRSWKWLINHQALDGWPDLKRSHLEAWLSARQEAGLAASTRTSELYELLSCLRFVSDRDIPLDANLFRVAYPERAEALPRYLEESEYNRLEQVVLAQTADDTPTSARDRAWFFTLAHTGLRISELLNLRLADLDLVGGRLIVQGKNKRDRVVYLTPTLTHALQAHLSHREAVADDHLWLDAGRPLRDQQVRYRLRRWGQFCGVAVTPHRLRHTLATRLINQGMSLESLRKLLGHKNLSMTQHYARIYDATVREQFQTAMANIEGIAVSDWPQSEIVLTAADQPVMLKSDSV